MKSRSRRASWLLFGALVATATSGCIKVKGFSCVLKFEEESTKLAILSFNHVFFVERNIFQKQHAALADAKVDLERFSESDRIWSPFLSFSELPTRPEHEDISPLAEMYRKLDALIVAEPGRFVLDEQGELCGYQRSRARIT